MIENIRLFNFTSLSPRDMKTNHREYIAHDITQNISTISHITLSDSSTWQFYELSLSNVIAQSMWSHPFWLVCIESMYFSKEKALVILPMTNVLSAQTRMSEILSCTHCLTLYVLLSLPRMVCFFLLPLFIWLSPHHG